MKAVLGAAPHINRLYLHYRVLADVVIDNAMTITTRLCHSDQAGKLQFSVCGHGPVARQSIVLSVCLTGVTGNEDWRNQLNASIGQPRLSVPGLVGDVHFYGRMADAHHRVEGFGATLALVLRLASNRVSRCRLTSLSLENGL